MIHVKILKVRNSSPPNTQEFLTFNIILYIKPEQKGYKDNIYKQLISKNPPEPKIVMCILGPVFFPAAR